MVQQTVEQRKRVIIVGGGFAGIQAAERLTKLPVDVILIDCNTHHTFQPLLYQAALAVLSPSDITRPIRSILRQKNVTVLLAEVMDIDRFAQRVVLDNGDVLLYDYLILATGTTSSYFGHNAWEEHAPSLKSIEDAVEVRSRILLAFEQAERAMASGATQPDLHFVVIGGGPTGVELAGAISDIAKHVLNKDFHYLDTSKARISLFEGAPSILNAFPENLRRSAVQQLESLGIRVHTSAQITDIQSDCIVVGEEKIASTITLWAAGVAPSTLGAKLQVPLDKKGCVIVDGQLNPAEAPRIFVCGDLAAVTENGRRIPATVQPAMQMGKHAAELIEADLIGKPRTAFHYFDKGDMATIGVKRAVAHIVWPFKADWSGLRAWLVWLFIHLLFLSGKDRQLSVLWTWAYSYVSRDARNRMVVRPRK